jgi:hypothetical protein
MSLLPGPEVIMGVVLSGLSGVLIVLAHFLQEWTYRRTLALPPSLRGFEIEADPPNRNPYLQMLENGALRLTMDRPQQRDWERTHARGMLRYVASWAALLVGSGMPLLLVFWAGGAPLLSLEDGAGGWMLIALPILGVVAGIVFWFFNKWSYRKGRAMASLPAPTGPHKHSLIALVLMWAGGSFGMIVLLVAFYAVVPGSDFRLAEALAELVWVAVFSIGYGMFMGISIWLRDEWLHRRAKAWKSG